VATSAGDQAEVSAAQAVAAAEEAKPAPDEERVPELVAALPGAAFDHEAMRRRIEETRNRLKAKAFDAMMSGESALLRESKAENNEAPTLTVEPEVDQTVETALTEEEF
jgi:hypothetical protein